MQYTINSLRQEIFGRVYNVYEVFKNFYGEQFTDLQEVPTDEDIECSLLNWSCTDDGNGNYEVSASQLRRIKNGWSTLKPFILVWWPRATITNENDRSVDIQDLYAKVTITMEGRIPYECTGFLLCRTTFSEIQFVNGYLHSHIPHFTGVPHFSKPCLGTGPIRNTILDLKNGYEEALWMLFCHELSLYVTVESLRGGPYFRMENIGSSKTLYGFTGYDNRYYSLNDLSQFHSRSSEKIRLFREIIKQFMLYYLQNGHLALNYKDGMFRPGMPYFDYMIDISNSFIELFNKYGNREDVQSLYNRGILIKSLAANNKFYESDASIDTDYSQYEGHDMFEFRGEMKHLHIEQETHSHTEVTLLLHHKIAMFILFNVLKIVNYRYKNEYRIKQLGDSSATVATTCQTVCYL